MSWIAPIQNGYFGTVYISRLPPSLKSKLPYVVTSTPADAYKFKTVEEATYAQSMCIHRHRTKVNYSGIQRIELTPLPVEEVA